MQNSKSNNIDIALLLLIFILGIFILIIIDNNKKKTSCKCNNYEEKKTKPYIITNQNEIPEWVIILKEKQMEMFK